MSITVYTKPDCSACHWTKKFLMQHNIPFTEIDVSVQTGAAEALRDNRFREMPVIQSDHGHWSGYQREKLQTLATAYSKTTGGQGDATTD